MKFTSKTTEINDIWGPTNVTSVDNRLKCGVSVSRNLHTVSTVYFQSFTRISNKVLRKVKEMLIIMTLHVRVSCCWLKLYDCQKRVKRKMFKQEGNSERGMSIRKKTQKKKLESSVYFRVWILSSESNGYLCPIIE